VSTTTSPDVAGAGDGSVGSGDAASPAPGPAPVAPPSTATSRAVTGRRVPWRLVAVGAVLAGAFAFLLAKGLGSSLDYFETVDQAVKQRAMLGTRTFRIEGLPSAVRASGGDVRFTLSAGGASVPVVFHGQPPQLFAPQVPVVLVGHFAGEQFVSDQMLVAHTQIYKEQHPTRVTAPDGTSR